VIEFLECGATQSGQRFLDSSAPRLIRHATFWKTAGGELLSSPAGKDKKLSRSARRSLAMLAPSQMLPRRATRAGLQAPSLRILPFGGVLPCGIPNPACIQASYIDPLPSPFRSLQIPLQSLYTASAGELAGEAQYIRALRVGGEAHHDETARVSSRPCLIAGNSRHYDEVGQGAETGCD
jgi:hypothetical protein